MQKDLSALGSLLLLSHKAGDIIIYDPIPTIMDLKQMLKSGDEKHFEGSTPT